DQITSTAAIGSPITYVTNEAYGPGTHMGLLAPGILQVGDIPHLSALAAPRSLTLVGGVTPQGKKVTEKQLRDAFRYTRSIYKLYKAEARLRIRGKLGAEDTAKLIKVI